MLMSYIGKRVADEVGSGLITTQVIIDYLRANDASQVRKKPRHVVAVQAAPGPLASMVAAAAAAAVAAAAAAAASGSAAALATASARKRK